MLTDVAIRKAQKRDKAYKIFDANGLYLAVTPAGGKLWRFRYKIGAKEKLLRQPDPRWSLCPLCYFTEGNFTLPESQE